MNNFSFYRGGKTFCFLFLMGVILSFSPIQANNSERRNLEITQQFHIQGTVTDGNNPLAGVSISIKGKPNATVTDYNGHYTLSASPDDILVFSYIGYQTQQVSIQGRTTININLQENATKLQEVKINAGYYSVKNSQNTGSISKITSKSIETQPVTNILATMQGRMAGVSITQTTGVPGGGFDIKIRGQNSIRPGANAPLYVIDGVPYSSDPIGYNQTTTTFPTITSPLNNINPDNIESIEVLKDADATSIYGSRGANGVVLVTTKKGKMGKTKFSITASSGVGQVTSFMKLMDTQQYLSMRAKAFANDGEVYQPWDYDINGTWDQKRYTNWQEELIGYREHTGIIANEKRKSLEQISEYEKKLSVARNLLVTEKIEVGDYNLMKKEYNGIISNLEKQIGNADDDKGNIEQLMNTGLENLLKLGEACENSSLADTRELIGLIYPENFTFRENQFQTTRINEIINCIYLVNNRLRAKKNGTKDDIFLLSRVVTSTGFKPVTF